MTETPTTDIRHEPSTQRFTLGIGETTALLTYRIIDASTLDFDHTFVPPALRGSGVASRLTAHALRYAALRGYKVVPSCPFVAAYLKRHPEFHALAV